ncbi:MFS transporter [Streptosporangium lutulentum]|uniref:DHA2 family methylenomycin A resistance protein-like MFS transporter n=1 Tax=Streptosporangium lutulentum TaxID=1461250 RepID=A0ABT9Q2B5_9ACTN|nr:MFS transporter [Streptosporangium lutulentum]MDP9840878.1 DHA2 family methylenomycin A resistance protein-like MFS transporter [Streptosporangium lutulentum]
MLATPSFRRLAGISLAYFLVLLDTTVLTVALPDLRASLGGTFADQQWAVNGYTVAFAASLLTGGAVSDRYGAARVFRLGVTGFGVISLMCALAPGMGILIALRALLGLAGALCLGSSLGLIAQLHTDPAGRARAMGVWAALTGTALAAGPLLGGLLVESYGWRAIFLVNPPLAVLSLIAVRGLVSAMGAGRIDWGVQVVACAFLGLLAAAITGFSVPAASLALVALAVLVWLQRRAPEPVLPGGSLRASWPGLLTGGVVNFAFSGALFVITLLLQGERGFTPLEAGLAFLPLTVPMTFNALLTGRLVARYGPGPSILAGLALLSAGLTAAPSAIGMIMVGLGLSCCLPALVADVVSTAPAGTAGTAGGLLNAVRQVGAVLGVAVMGVVAHGTADGTSRALLLAAVLTALTLVVRCGTHWAGRRAAGQDSRVPVRPPM